MILYDGDEIQYQAVAASIWHTYGGSYMDGALPPSTEKKKQKKRRQRS